MPLIYTDDYDLEFVTMNPHIAFLYVESHKVLGGGRMTAVLRGHLKGIPITLRENYTDDGYLREETQARDKQLLIKQFKDIHNKYKHLTSLDPYESFDRMEDTKCTKSESTVSEKDIVLTELRLIRNYLERLTLLQEGSLK